MEITIEELQAYLLDHYRYNGIDESLFMKLAGGRNRRGGGSIEQKS